MTKEQRRKMDAVLASQPGRVLNRPWSKLHTVEPNAGGWFDVTSGRSGEKYRVQTDGTCNCEAGERRMPCTHVLAVKEYAEAVLVEAARAKVRGR